MDITVLLVLPFLRDLIVAHCSNHGGSSYSLYGLIMRVQCTETGLFLTVMKTHFKLPQNAINQELVRRTCCYSTV
ncbi:hypothetical protein C8R48DRAFT_21266 [Suillus tomentosus]|nr:hypothetical protein C8R48DRAFT_21266 [Suillus tomentosus]